MYYIISYKEFWLHKVNNSCMKNLINCFDQKYQISVIVTQYIWMCVSIGYIQSIPTLPSFEGLPFEFDSLFENIRIYMIG